MLKFRSLTISLAVRTVVLTTSLTVLQLACAQTTLAQTTLDQAPLNGAYVEGVHYSVVDETDPRVSSHKQGPQTFNSPSVVEYFSFSCPGCYAIEPSLTTLMNGQPSTVLERVHMPFGGRQAKLSQKAFVVMTLLNAQEHKDAIFKRMHVERDLFDSDKELVGYFSELGYEKEKVEQSLDSFSADTLIRKMNKAAKDQKISSVPTLIINHRYKVNIGSLATTESLGSLVKYLHELDRKSTGQHQ